VSYQNPFIFQMSVVVDLLGVRKFGNENGETEVKKNRT